MSASNPDEQEDCLFEDLYQEVKDATPGAQLSSALQCRLEKLNRDARAALCSRTKDECSPLFVACKHGNDLIAEYLITVCMADMEQRGMYEIPNNQSVHVTPLWCASVAGHIGVVEALVRCGADVNAVSDTGSTPVRSACFMTHVDVVKLLVRNSADIQRPNNFGGTCLINSVQSAELCEFLLLNGANVNMQDIRGRAALHYAIQEGWLETTKLLLLYNADPFLETASHRTPMHFACFNGHLAIVQLLLGRGAEVNRTDDFGSTPLHDACQCGHQAVAQLLITNGANVNVVNTIDHNTSLHHSCQNGHISIVQLLMKNGAYVSVVNANGDTPFHLACSHGHPEAAQVLIDIEEDGKGPLYS